MSICARRSMGTLTMNRCSPQIMKQSHINNIVLLYFCAARTIFPNMFLGRVANSICKKCILLVCYVYCVNSRCRSR